MGMNIFADGDVERDLNLGESLAGPQMDQPVSVCQRQHIGFALRQFGEHQVGFQFGLVKAGPADLFAAAIEVVGYDVADIAAPVDAVGDDHAVVMALEFQPESGFLLCGLSFL